MDLLNTYRRKTFALSVLIALLFNGWFLSWLLLKPGTYDRFAAVDNLAQTAGYFIAALFCLFSLEFFSGLRFNVSAFVSRPQNAIAILFSLSLILSSMGQAIWTYYEQVLHQAVPMPSWADVAFLSSYPFQLFAILLLPARPLSGRARTRVLLDGLVIMTVVMTCSWYFILGPTILQGNQTLLARVVGGAYPFLDTVTVFCLILLTFRNNQPSLRLAITLLSLALILIVITDSLFDYQALQDTYATGTLVDLGWPLGSILIGLAVQAMGLAKRNEPGQSKHGEEGAAGYQHGSDDLPSLWRSLLPYLFVFVVLALVVYIWHVGDQSSLAEGVYVGAFLLTTLVVIRQVLVIQETISTNRQLHRIQQELQVKNSALSNANEQLEKQAELLAAAYEEQRHLNKLKNEFLQNVNHELRTPLTEALGYLNLLLEYDSTLDAATRAIFIKHAVEGCEALQSLVNNVTETIRSDFHERAPQQHCLNIAQLVDETLQIFEQKKLCRIEQHISKDIAALADRQLTRQVLLNVLSNAFKYSPPESPVMVSVTPITETTASGASTFARICIQDKGPGIPPEDIPRLFGKFARLERDIAGAVRGSGLGLYISKQLVEKMGGRIWVESEGIPGQGSRFYFTLPLASEDGQGRHRSDGTVSLCV